MRQFYLFYIVVAALNVIANNLTIAERGKQASYTIMIPSEATESQRYAAKELSEFTEQMTGVKLPVVNDDTPLPKNAILLGVTKFTEKAVGPVDLKKLGNDGFTLKTAGTHICIVGSGVRGTLYGVYELLEKHGGCRWYSSWHSRIPKLDKWEIPELNDTQTPAFIVREPFWYDMFKGDFAARSRSNGNRPQLKEKHGGKIRFGGGMFVHTFHYLCSTDKYFDEHPEYFSMVKGKRLREHTQLCLTNPDVLKIVTEETLKRIRKDPTAKLFSVSQNDWRNPCECPACKAIDDKEGSHAGTMIQFVNKVAEAVEKEFPEVWIETLAYQYTRTPPKFVRPRHNVVPRLCTIECDFSHPLNQSEYEQNKSLMSDISGWSKMTDKLFIWDYVTNFRHYIGPFPNVLSLQENIKIFRENHVVALFEQGAYNGAHGEFAELKAWLIAKLLWNPDQDVNVLIDDFMTGYYGAAAPCVKEYLLALHKLFENPQSICRIFDTIYTKPEITDDFMQYAELLWHRAETAVKDDPAFLYNVRMSKIPIVYSKLQRTQKSYKEEPVITADNTIKSVGASEDYIARASQLISLLNESKEKIYIREHHESERIILDKIQSVVTGTKLLKVKNDEIEATLSPQWGGSITSIKLGGKDFTGFTRGGINIFSSLTGARSYNKKKFSIGKQTTNLIELKTPSEDRCYTTTKDSLTVDTTFKTTSKSRTLSPTWRIPLTLGANDSISWKSGEGKWISIRLKPDAICDTFPIPTTEIKSGTLELAGESSLRGVKLNFGNAELTRFDVEINRNTKTVMLIVGTEELTFDAYQNRKVSLNISPVKAVSGLIKSKSILPIRTVYEDNLLGLGKEGEWCARVTDKQAVNYSAAKLFNTHYEWCTTLPISQTDYKKGQRYKVRIRVRVEAKKGVVGEALWAGIHDPKNKKSHGQVSKKTDFFKDSNYIWLDVAEWVPADYHYFWIGPGRFDKEKGESAIEALYIDRVEMVEI